METAMDDLDARLEFRLPAAMKKAFLECAREADRDAAQLLRDFIRAHLKANAQPDLLSHAKPTRRKG